jgi:hypothetical protein
MLEAHGIDPRSSKGRHGQVFVAPVISRSQKSRTMEVMGCAVPYIIVVSAVATVTTRWPADMRRSS